MSKLVYMNKYYGPNIKEFCKEFKYEYKITIHYSNIKNEEMWKSSLFGSLDEVDSLLVWQARKEGTTIFDILEKNTYSEEKAEEFRKWLDAEKDITRRRQNRIANQTINDTINKAKP